MLLIISIAIIIFVVFLFFKVKSSRLKVALLIGLGTTIFAFFVAILILLFFEIVVFWLLAVSYVSIITFLILWNLRRFEESKKVYLMLCIPVICFLVSVGVVKHREYVQTIPAVEEMQRYSLSMYQPFRADNELATLDKKSSFKITDNLPILDGATALYPVYASFAQAVYPEGTYSLYDKSVNDKDTSSYDNLVRCTTTNSAYDNLLHGKVDIIFCAKPSDMQLGLFNDENLNLKLVPIGKEAFVFFVNKDNPVDNLSVADIRGIYSGKIKNWKKLGGKFQSIKAFQREKNSGSQTALENIMGSRTIIKPRRENVVGTMGGMISAVAVYRNFPDAIGYSFLYFATSMVKNDQIKLLAIDGIPPTRETIQDGSYPFADDFYAIYIDSYEKNEYIEPFINWILSAQGQELIKKTGYVPL